MAPDQVEAVLRNDFDKMTYRTYWEVVTSVSKLADRGWWDMCGREAVADGPQPRKFRRREFLRANNSKLCTIRTVFPSNRELWSLRRLLMVLPARTWDDLKAPLAPRVEHYASFHEAAEARGLVEDDNEAELTMQVRATSRVVLCGGVSVPDHASVCGATCRRVAPTYSPIDTTRA